MPELKDITGPVILGAHGQVAAFHQGKQVASLQHSFIDLWIAEAERQGYNIKGMKFDLPSGTCDIIEGGSCQT